MVNETTRPLGLDGVEAVSVGLDAELDPPATTPEEVIDHLRIHGLELAYDPRTRTLEIVGKPTARTTP